MRATSDKSLRLVLSTFKNLREELCHLQDDLGVSPAPHPAAPAAPSWQQEPRAGAPGCACAGGSGCSLSTSGGWMDRGGFGSSPGPVAVDAGSRQFLLGKQQCFPHQPKCLALLGMSQHCPENVEGEEFEFEHRTRVGCSGLSFGVVFVCLGVFVGFYLNCFWGRLEGQCPGSQCSPPSTKPQALQCVLCT